MSGRGHPAYWLFLFAIGEVELFLNVAIQRGDSTFAFAVVAATLTILSIWFVRVVVRLVRRPDWPTGGSEQLPGRDRAVADSPETAAARVDPPG